MKYFLIFIILLIIEFESFSQMNSIDQKINDLKQKYLIPKLTKEQMYEDFDSLYSAFKLCNPQLEVRKQVTGTDILSEIQTLRKEVDTIKNIESFVLLLYRAIRLSQDPHFQIGTSIWFYRYSLYKKEAKKYNNDFFACTFHFRDIINKNVKEFIYFKYIKGNYFLLYPLLVHINNDSVIIPAGTIIKEINKLSINEYIQKYEDIQTDLRWDFEKKNYYVNLLKCYSSYQIESMEYLSINNTLNKMDSITGYKQEVKSFGMANFIDAKNVTYFSKDSLLYIRCPLMNTSDMKYYKNEIRKIKGIPIEKVVIDIRQNWGGNDEVWMLILKQIIKKPIETNVVFLSKINPACARFIKNKGGFPNDDKTINPLWDKTTKYKLVYDKTMKIKPANSSLQYDGDIYILQDEDIYSAGASLSAMASYNDKIINVGCSNGKLGGRGIEAMSFGLPNSKLIFVMNILIDNTNAKTAADVYHNDVEVPVSLPIEYYINREKYQENIYSEEYLYNHDLLFKTVLEIK